MHSRKGVIGNLLIAVALVTSALALTAPAVATPTHAQTTPASNSLPAGCDIAGSPAGCLVGAYSTTDVTPGVAFNQIGAPHTEYFTCGGAVAALTGTTTPPPAPLPVAPGCYNVTATVTDEVTGGTGGIIAATCGSSAATPSGGSVNCASVQSPLCPVGFNLGGAGTCVPNGLGAPPVNANNQVAVTIQEGAPHPYLITFTGYIPRTAAGTCPAGTTPTASPFTVFASAGVPPIEAPLMTTGMCQFTVSAEKKYVEITSITLHKVTGSPCGGNIIFAEGLKAFFGPTCKVFAVVTGTIVIKQGVDCAQEPATGTAAPPEYTLGVGFANPTYSCTNGNLSVQGVPVPGAIVTFNVSGSGAFAGLHPVVFPGTGLCAASSAGGTTFTTQADNTGVTGVVTVCATGPGSGSITATAGVNAAGNPFINSQPAVASSNSIPFSFTTRESRVVPMVRWAGEKVVLTKCFGPGFSGSPVEFTLKGDNPGLNATLIPAALSGPLNGGAGNPGLGTGNTFPGVADQNTIWTVADISGCATVIGYADGEGVMNVDASIFNPVGVPIGGAVTPQVLVNEHAFEVFYLKFDHLDLENINPAQQFTTATALIPFSGFLAGTPVLSGTNAFAACAGSGLGCGSGVTPVATSFTLPSPPGTSGESAGPTGFSVPLCATQFIRAMVHGYFEIPGDPSGRPASTVAIPGAPTNSAGSYQLPAGRWVLPEDWPLLATFAGFGTQGNQADFTPSSVLAWDLNSGWAFDQSENIDACGLGAGIIGNGLLLYLNADEVGGFGQAVSSMPAGMLGNNGSEDLGPCFGKSNGTVYATAPGSLTPGGEVLYQAATGLNCSGGATMGFGSFDPVQSCTDPFPLAYTPAGASLFFFTGPNGLNSDYLPNSTVNEWDAPMPPAQISFGITNGGPGFLGEVNKTGLYAIVFAETANANGTCPDFAYTFVSANGDCELEIDPNPFYAEAIPASPLIPPITNNGGYLWNTWATSSGVGGLVGAAPFATAPAGGFVPGQSTTAAAVAAGTCPPGFVNIGGAPPGTCQAALGSGFTAASCESFGGTVVAGPPAVCQIPAQTGGTKLRGGTGLTNFGPACPAPANPTSVTIANGQGYMVGMTVMVLSRTGMGVLYSGLVISDILPNPQPGYPNAVTLQFTAASVAAAGVTCVPAFSADFVSEQFGLPLNLASTNQFACGQDVTVVPPTPGSIPFQSTVACPGGTTLIDVANNIVYVNGANAIAIVECGGNLSSSAACEPSAIAPPGSTISSAPSSAPYFLAPPNHTTGNTGPYPFWEWIPGPPGATASPSSGTVYSDNHGEAVVALTTGLPAFQIKPVNGACTAPYQPIVVGTTVVSCLLPFTALGTTSNPSGAAFSNVAKAISGFSASKPGCIATFPSGTSAVVPGATVGATGPAAGQICINALGGIEFGAQAVLGATTVNAVADYPYTRGEHAPIGSGPLTKLFTSGFAKTLTVSPGTPGPAGTTSYTVTITALDVCGNPITGEPVQVYVLGNAGAAVLAPVSAGAILSTSTTSAEVLVTKNGTATFSLEVLNSALGNQGLVVKAVFPFEKIERFATVVSGTTSTGVTVVYPPGWQQIGGPSGSNFSVAEAVFSWDTGSQSYTNATASAGNLSSAAPACTGYWAYFAAAMTVTLPGGSKPGDTATCNLAPGWNLIGNPFGSPASLPSGTTAYHWNGTSYDTVGLIPTGGSVWIFNSGTTATTVTLTAT